MPDLTDIEIVSYEAQSKLLELALEVASSTSRRKVFKAYKRGARIRRLLRALEVPYLTADEKEIIVQCIISVAEIYDFPAAPVLEKAPYPNIYIRATGGGGGLPSGGATNQYLKKATSADGDVVWDTLTLTDITDISVITNELNALQGITDNIQDQLDAKLSSALLQARIFVGNGSNVAVGVVVSGDISISSAGVTELQDSAVINSKISAVAGIQFTKMEALAASRVTVTNGSGFTVASTVTVVELETLGGISSNIQTQIDAKVGTTLASARLFVGNVSNVATATEITGDITINNTGVTAISSGVIWPAD